MIRIIRSAVIATEDSSVINKVSRVLQQHDCTVIIEKSTIKSILKILEKDIDFVILDIDFPQNSNMDLIDIIKKTRPKLPILILSKDNSLETLRTLAKLGIFYCILKPIQDPELEEIIQTLVRFRQTDSDMATPIYNHIARKTKKIS